MAESTFDDFLRIREDAENAYVRGDGCKLDAIVPHEGNASVHTLQGETVTGAQSVAARYLKGAEAFQPNGTSRFEVMHQSNDNSLGFWTGLQIATVQLGDMPRPVNMRIRVTEVFRKDDGQWKLIHRHADVPSD
jgi:ketosteroid isomerase-like protein